MLSKLTSKNQLTLPKGIVSLFPSIEYFDISTEDGRLVLTPVRLQSANKVRDKLNELGINQEDINKAIKWSRGEWQSQ